MAGKGKFKIGADVGYVDNLGNPLICGAYVRHFITGKEGTITQYGVVKGVDGTNYKLCDNFWEVVEKKEEPIDLGIADCDLEAKDVKKDVAAVENKVTGEKKLAVVCEKTLADFSDDELLAEVAQRGFGVRTLAEHGIKTFGIPEAEDTALPALICGLRKTEGLCVTKIVKPMRVYRVLYYTQDAKGSITPQHEDFFSFWRAKLEVWLLRRKKEVTQDIGICIFDKEI